MPIESPRPLARQLLRVVLGASDVSDRDLLARFVASRDEEAFAEIVRRHGPMVLAACRRVTRRPHDAEDAFQAAFLVLARRAAHLTRPELLANWLYGVAYRTALDARAARLRAEEHVVASAPEPTAPAPPDDTADLRRAIDEELARLPDKYRTAVVLCDLEGLPRVTAAAQLGIPEGTLSSRLAHARKILAARLTRRGVTASVVAITAALGRESIATAVPHTLTHLTVHAAVRFVPGGGVSAGVSPTVSTLTDGVLKTMLVTRLRQTFAVGLLVCGLIGVGGALAQQLGRPAALQDPTAPLRPLVADENQLDPVAGAQPKPPEPKKVAAKGVEDDDVPYASFPAQAVVRLEDGKLIVRQRGHHYEPVTEQVGDRQVTSYKLKSGVRASTHDPADIAVFDMKGNRLSPKAWKEMLKSDVHALVANDGKLPNPRELTLFKPDTLLIVLPAQQAPAYAPIPDSRGATYYVPTPVAPIPPTSTVPARPGIAPPAAVPAQNTRPITPRPAVPAAPVPPVTFPGGAAPALPPTPALPDQNQLPPLELPGTPDENTVPPVGSVRP